MQRVLAWWWVLVPLVAAGELGRQAQIEGQVPAATEWQAAARAISLDYRAGDLVVVAPEWAAQVAREHLGERLVPLEDVARADTARYARLWVVSIRGARAPEEAGARLQSTTQHGHVTVRRLALPAPAHIHYDFVRSLHLGRASMVKGTATTPCPWIRTTHGIGGGRFRCDARRDWNHVGVEVLDDLDRRPRMGIWAHPAKDAAIAVEFDDVLLGDRLVGHTGLRYESAKRGTGGPVQLRVRIGERAYGPFVERDADSWKRFVIDTSGQAGHRAHVRFEVTARDPSMRHFYFAADTRTGGPR